MESANPGGVSTKRTLPVAFLQNELSGGCFYKTNCPVAVSTKRTVRWLLLQTNPCPVAVITKPGNAGGPLLQNELSGGRFYKTNCPVGVSTKRTVRWPFLQNELSGGRFYKTNCPVAVFTKRTVRWPFLQNELSGGRFYKTNCPAGRVGVRQPPPYFIRPSQAEACATPDVRRHMASTCRSNASPDWKVPHTAAETVRL